MDPHFARWFADWASDREVYLVSGSDYPKTLEQVGQSVIGCVHRVYSCSGNAVWERGKLIQQSDWQLPLAIETILTDLLANSQYPERCGNHIEKRIGLCNFSIVGRDATHEQRQDYYNWDRTVNERFTIAFMLNELFDDIEAVVGGEISIDIYAKGANKGQVADEIGEFVFFGDKCELGGNDHAIAQRAIIAHAVKDWQETAEILHTHYS